MRDRLVYHWKHGWIPLTHAAALSKAHGNSKLADKYVHGTSEHHLSVRSRGQSADRIHSSLRPHSAILGKDLSGLSDHTLASLLHNANEAEIEHVLTELDRRDKVMRQARRAAERHEAKRRQRDDRFEELVSAGHDPEEAYASVYGVSVERQRRDRVITALRENGYRGAGFDVLTRAAFADYLDQQFRDAENVTNGYLFKGHDRRRNDIGSVRKLFSGSETYARANASEELLAYWQRHGRLTLHDFRASMLGGRLHAKGQKAWL